MTMPPNHPDLARGVDLFNRARFFDAHEELEDVWRSVPGDCPSRRHIQGMVQLAVAFHHESTATVLVRARFWRVHSAISTAPMYRFPSSISLGSALSWQLATLSG